MKALDADFGIIGEGERFSLLLDILENKKSQNTGFDIPGNSGDYREKFFQLPGKFLAQSPGRGHFKRNFQPPGFPHINFK